MEEVTKRYAVVTGANKGIGLEICKQLASKGITVVLTARNEKRGLEAVEKLKEHGLSDHVVFHQLDVLDPASIASLVEFIKTQFGKLDILVNNAGIIGVEADFDALKAAGFGEVNNAGIMGVEADFDALKAAGFGKVINAGIIGVEADFDALKAAGFGKVNNAGTIGVEADFDALKAAGFGKPGTEMNWSKLLTQTPVLSEECLQTNYYGAKKLSESLIPFLQLSDSPRIVNVSSSTGKLEKVANEWAKTVLSDAENLTEQKVDEVLSQYMKDFKEGSLEAKGWPAFISAYILSKAAMNAYTRILAKKYPSFRINCVCPGFVKTDINYNTGILTVEEGAASPVRLALLPNDGPSGLFFFRMEESEF